MATAAGLINEALLMIGQLAEDEQPSAAQSQSALIRLNSLVQSLNNESLLVYQIQDEVFTLTANSISATIGAGGDFDTTWPIEVLDSTFSRNNTTAPHVDFQIAIINNDQYSSIPVKNTTGPYPQYIYYERSYPLGRLFFWPVPISTLELHLSTWKPLTSFSGLTTQVNLPPGYEEMLTFNLAPRLAPSYGVSVSPEVKQFAMESKRNLKRANDQHDVMSLPGGMPGMCAPWSYYSIYRGMP